MGKVHPVGIALAPPGRERLRASFPQAKVPMLVTVYNTSCVVGWSCSSWRLQIHPGVCHLPELAFLLRKTSSVSMLQLPCSVPRRGRSWWVSACNGLQKSLTNAEDRARQRWVRVCLLPPEEQTQAHSQVPTREARLRSASANERCPDQASLQLLQRGWHFSLSSSMRRCVGDLSLSSTTPPVTEDRRSWGQQCPTSHAGFWLKTPHDRPQRPWWPCGGLVQQPRGNQALSSPVPGAACISPCQPWGHHAGQGRRAQTALESSQFFYWWQPEANRKSWNVLNLV